LDVGQSNPNRSVADQLSWFWRSFNTAAIKAGIGPLGNPYASPHLSVLAGFGGYASSSTKKLMRHSDIRTTMSYGDIVDDRMKEAHSKVASLVFRNAGLKEEVGRNRDHLPSVTWVSAVHSV